ncbi:MAG: hypothetical protein ABR573_06610 [Candidatus Dormibacteria bacterium]
MTAALLTRVILAPALVAIATLAARRWGPAAAGWAAATPVVAGPVLLVFVLDHGVAFGAQSAAAATLGLVSLAVFTVAYARLAMRGLGWYLCLPLGWAAFLAVTAILSLVSLPGPWAFLLAVAAFALLRSATGEPRTATAMGRSLPADIPLRMVAALLMVLTLGLIAGMLGPRLSGLLAPFPVIGSVMAAFTQITRGRDALQGYSLALLKGLPSFAMFTATVAITLQPWGTPAAFMLAALASAGSHAVLIFIDTRGSADRDRPRVPAGSR